jgi:outer membrane lipoprotein-sorting protein
MNPVLYFAARLSNRSVSLTIFSLSVLAVCLFAMPAYSSGEVDIKPIDPTKVKKIESYLNTLSTARARFVQTTHSGTQLVGTFYLDRPGKLRFEYDQPIEDFVVADGTFIYFYDAEAREQTNAPIGQTLADFILRRQLSFDRDLTVVRYDDQHGLILVEVVQTADPGAGSLTLGFEQEPLQLKKWRIVDAQDMITEVELFYLKKDVTHPSGLFVYRDPAHGTERRLNR